MRRRKFLSATTGAITILAGCASGGGGGGGGGGPSTKAEGEAAATFRLQPPVFEPYKFVIGTGETAEWISEADETLEVVSGAFHDIATQWELSQTLEPGERHTRTFDEAGVYEFYVPSLGKDTMCGAVIVGENTAFGRYLPCEL